MTDARTLEDALRQMGELVELLRRELGSPGPQPPLVGAQLAELGAPCPELSDLPASTSGEAVLDALRERGLAPRPPKASLRADVELGRQAVRIGRNIAAFEPMLAVIRRTITQQRPFRFVLGEDDVGDRELLAAVTEWSRLGLIAGFRHDRRARAIYGQPVGTGRAFFAGGWLEHFVAGRVERLFGIGALRNVIVELPAGRAAELDCLLLWRGRLLWLESRSGRFADRLSRYGELRAQLQIEPDDAAVVASTVSQEYARTLSALHGVRVIALVEIDDALLAMARAGGAPLDPPMADDAESSGAVASSAPASGWEDQLDQRERTILRGATLRPHAAHRSRILAAVTTLLRRQPAERWDIRGLAGELAQQCGVSRGVVREVIRAADAGGAFARDPGREAADLALITGLSGAGSADLETCCRRAYRAALRAADPSIDVLSAVPE